MVLQEAVAVALLRSTPLAGKRGHRSASCTLLGLRGSGGARRRAAPQLLRMLQLLTHLAAAAAAWPEVPCT